jgi:hypothetical protein
VCKAQFSGPKRVWNTRGDHTNTNVICKVNVVEAAKLATVLQYRLAYAVHRSVSRLPEAAA